MFRFSTKARTLERLRRVRLKYASIPELLYFSVSAWKRNPKRVLLAIAKKFGKRRLIVRSSALAEDSESQSLAGRFLSMADISKNLENAINAVIASYENEPGNHEVLIQPFLSSVEVSGVVLTADLSTRAPYFIINYDDASGTTHTVTSGSTSAVKTVVVFRKSIDRVTDRRLRTICRAAAELQRVCRMTDIDIEFAFQRNRLWILQVRPMTGGSRVEHSEDRIGRTLELIRHRINELAAPHPDLYGNKTLYGIMPDWNPAEMIGIRPRPLALSLYRELITDSVWAYQRDNYGYKRLRSFPLMVSFAGHPYIDVRVDFTSFIPKTLDDRLSHKLANYYLKKLEQYPASHDKVEFDIVLSCYTLDLDERLKELNKHGFSNSEIDNLRTALVDLTNTAMRPSGLLDDDLAKLATLEQRRTDLLASKLSPINTMYWLIEDCKRYGTLPFAGIARSAFIAVQFLKSMVQLDILTAQERDAFLASMNTVASQLADDSQALKHGRLSRKEFLKRYGHLRPGTYDILSPSYEEHLDAYFHAETFQSRKKTAFQILPSKHAKLDRLLQSHGITSSGKQCFAFIKKAIEGRELGKFMFTKNANEFFRVLKTWGNGLGFSPDDLSFLEVGTLIKLYSTVAFFDEQQFIAQEIERNRKTYALYGAVKLPHLISKPDDILWFHLDATQPNYITRKEIIGNPYHVKSGQKTYELAGKIAFIESADPGYDWIFSHNIAGLVTMYGGANSHMAIRAAELQIPAVIGCGPILFEKLKGAQKIHIDCTNQRIITLA
ncbi:MAG: hypothetical protein A3A33_01605 [Candidatus Yanofskybacteria bacterium RIFCSPLOWO2_01_FULL_49_25]|uniref:PEP-utilising enzyme mobile domain-containing protein n=1 Tax=Candidatus Yanofskybacteria bacterium RIFCSPLOWO2_01_FULL_49_25 TaxID=1802701 RepID=A0A1F8GYC9_9BACT|nr:MAG: hypothetical protein A3A33_01605 [Candidatus Yanofskybacteria bacterium RIFCSPLOWO2_01_FULL_49_25]